MEQWLEDIKNDEIKAKCDNSEFPELSGEDGFSCEYSKDIEF